MTNPIRGIEDAVAGAMAFARRIGGRDVLVSAEGIQVVDGMGRTHTMRRDGVPYVPDMADFKAKARGSCITFREMGDLGDWEYDGKDGGYRIRAKRVSPSCVDGLFSHEAEDLARLRSLYGRGDVVVAIVVEGDQRARDIAMGLVAERRLCGLPTTLSIDDAALPRLYHRDRRDFQGPEAFDPPQESTLAPEWEIRCLGRNAIDHALRGAGTGGAVLVGTCPAWGLESDCERYVAGQETPMAFVKVGIVKSQPVARIVLNAAAMALSSPEPGFADAPWHRHAERVAKRAGRPAAPKTWFSTTEAVAEAFVARKSPRGYVSGKSLFFHGPIAYSVWDNHVIAAYVKGPDGNPLLVLGRDRTVGGGKSAIASMAMNDISLAAGRALPVVQDLGDVILLGAARPGDVPFQGRARKNEADFPELCHFDQARLSKWLLEEAARLRKAIEEAYSTGVTYPTRAQARAKRALASLLDLRDRYAADYGFELPALGDRDLIDVEARAAEVAARMRTEELEARKKAETAEEEPQGLAP